MVAFTNIALWLKSDLEVSVVRHSRRGKRTSVMAAMLLADVN